MKSILFLSIVRALVIGSEPVLFGSTLQISNKAASEGEVCGAANGERAITGLCCSEWGYAGASVWHCGKGCQLDYSDSCSPKAKNGNRCGADVNLSAEPGLCCSEWGYAGSSIWHCGEGCQSEYSDSCTMTMSEVAQEGEKCGSIVKIRAAPGLCCSAYGYAGKSYWHCDNEEGCQTDWGTCTGPTFANLNERCGSDVKIRAAMSAKGDPTKSGLCCSEAGYAGYTSGHCGPGCQTAWGRCDTGALPSLVVGCSQPKTFAITFDDGPSAITASLLDYLKSENVVATFFLNGQNVLQSDVTKLDIYSAEGQALVKRIEAEGHQICSHTWSHVAMTTVDEEVLTVQMTRLNHAFKTILGKIPTCVRPPFGDISDSTSKLLQGMGYGADADGAIAIWNVDPVDWNPSIHGSTAQVQIDDMTREVKEQSDLLHSGLPSMPQFTGTLTGQPGTIVLSHDVWTTTADFRSDGALVSQGIKPFTQREVEYLRANEFRLVRLDECLGKAINSMYRSPSPNDDICGKGSCE